MPQPPPIPSPFPYTGPVLEIPSQYPPGGGNVLELPQSYYPATEYPSSGYYEPTAGPTPAIAQPGVGAGFSLVGFAAEALGVLVALIPEFNLLFASQPRTANAPAPIRTSTKTCRPKRPCAAGFTLNPTTCACNAATAGIGPAQSTPGA